MKKPVRPTDNHNAFAFRLPEEHTQWFNEHVEGARENRHQAMTRFVVWVIEGQPDYRPNANDPLTLLRLEMEQRLAEQVQAIQDQIFSQTEASKADMRAFVRKLLEDNVLYGQVKAVRDSIGARPGEEITDDAIDDILNGVL